MRTHWAKMYRLDVIKKMNLSNCNIIPYGSDTLFVREALLMSNRVGIMPEALYTGIMSIRKSGITML